VAPCTTNGTDSATAIVQAGTTTTISSSSSSVVVIVSGCPRRYN